MATSTLVSIPRRPAESAVYLSCCFVMYDSFGTASLSSAFCAGLSWRCFLEHLPMATTAGSPRRLLGSAFLSVLTV